MSLFCLVHGSTQNAAGWELLTAELTRQGHEAVCPELPADVPDASATVYADVIAKAVPSDQTIVVAHSASGMFLPLVAAQRPIRKMVFLTSVIPKLETSIFGQFQADRSMFNPEWLGKDPTKSDEIARQFLFHDCSPEVTRWALTTLRLMNAKQAMMETCPLKAWPSTPPTYILCTEDRAIEPEWSRRAARELLGVEALELPGGHCPHVSRPAELAAMLAAIGA